MGQSKYVENYYGDYIDQKVTIFSVGGKGKTVILKGAGRYELKGERVVKNKTDDGEIVKQKEEIIFSKANILYLRKVVDKEKE